MAHYKMNLIGKMIDCGCGPKMENTKKMNWLEMQMFGKNIMD
jgi:hypothetical protein